MRAWSVLGLVAVLSGLVWGCLWDRDTLIAEAEGLPEVLEVVAGRIDRNPDLYYTMRIGRVLEEVQERPCEWGLYDDLGVAYDRTGDSGEAIAWMLRKEQAMSQAGLRAGAEWEDAEYKRLANLGTFKLLDWLRSGADYGDTRVLESGVDDIRRALEINPDAHFGRERVQLAYMEALLNPGQARALFLAERLEDISERDGRFLEGVTGIMVLGEGWDSVDLFKVLSAGLSRSDAMMRHLIGLKVKDLEEKGKSGYLERLPEHWSGGEYMIEDRQKDEVARALAALIAHGEEYREHRERFMLGKLEKGEHPDTHEDFWEGYKAVSLVDVGEFAPRVGYQVQTIIRYMGIGVIAVGGLVCFFLIVRRLKKAVA